MLLLLRTCFTYTGAFCSGPTGPLTSCQVHQAQLTESHLVFILTTKTIIKYSSKNKLKTKDLMRVLTNLENVVAVGVKRSLSQFDDEDAVGATGLSVQTGVGHLPLFLTWRKNNRRQPFLFSHFFPR